MNRFGATIIGALRAVASLLLVTLVFMLEMAAGPARADAGDALAPSPPLVLQSSQPTVDAWPAVRLLMDPQHELSAEQAIAAMPGFKPPTGPRANLGRRPETVWLHIPLVLRDAASEWWLAVDYPSLDEVEILLLHDGRIVQRALTGDHLPVAQRAAQTRQLAAALHLQPGLRYDLLLRVRTSSALIVPISLLRTSQLVADEALTQAVQGVIFGLGLSLLVYTLIGLAVLRDAMFLWFAIAIVATTLFFSTYFGIAAQYLWPQSQWLTRNASPLMMIVLMIGGALFLERSLEMRTQAPRAALAMQGVALLSLLAALLFVGGVLSYRGATAVVTYLGLAPMLIALPVAFRLARAGDRIARLTFVGWVVYTAGIVVFALMQAGRLDFSQPAHHALQVGSLVQMTMWVAIMGVRAGRLREQAAHTRRERDRLLTMAHTDPLTGLLNRRGLDQAMQALMSSVNERAMAAIYVIDLDGFKPVNDKHGHDAGDELLVQVGARLKQALRAMDLVARTGGDEFIIVAAHLKNPREAEQIGHKLLACCDAPFQLSHASCSIGMTVGYALAPADGTEAQALIKRADAAMYAGKQSGKRRVARAGAGLAPA